MEKVEFEVRGLFESGWIKVKVRIESLAMAVTAKNDWDKTDPSHRYEVFKIVTTLVPTSW